MTSIVRLNVGGASERLRLSKAPVTGCGWRRSGMDELLYVLGSYAVRLKHQLTVLLSRLGKMEGVAAAERQPPPSSALRALVLDFDSTISQPVYLERHNVWACADRRALFADMRDDEILANFGGEARVRHLDAMLSQLRARGVALFIVSVGFREAFMPPLRKVNLLGHFDDRCIYGQDSPELREVLVERELAHYGERQKLGGRDTEVARVRQQRAQNHDLR